MMILELFCCSYAVDTSDTCRTGRLTKEMFLSSSASDLKQRIHFGDDTSYDNDCIT